MDPTTNTAELEDKYNKLLEQYNSLSDKVINLQATVARVQAENVITQKVNKTLSQQLDDLQKYSRRSCMVVDGSPIDTNESRESLKERIKEVVCDANIDSGTNFYNNFDKCHRIGPKRDGRQSCIVKFKSHSFREHLYKSKKKLNRNVRFKVSLTKRRIQLLKLANNEILNRGGEVAKVVKFAYADADGNLKLLLHAPTDRGWTHPFQNEDELMDLLSHISSDRGPEPYSDSEY